MCFFSGNHSLLPNVNENSYMIIIFRETPSGVGLLSKRQEKDLIIVSTKRRKRYTKIILK